MLLRYTVLHLYYIVCLLGRIVCFVFSTEGLLLIIFVAVDYKNVIVLVLLRDVLWDI